MSIRNINYEGLTFVTVNLLNGILNQSLVGKVSKTLRGKVPFENMHE